MQKRQADRTRAQVAIDIEVGDRHEVDSARGEGTPDFRSNKKCSRPGVRVQGSIVSAVETREPDSDKVNAGAAPRISPKGFGEEGRLTRKARNVNRHTGPEQTRHVLGGNQPRHRCLKVRYMLRLPSLFVMVMLLCRLRDLGAEVDKKLAQPLRVGWPRGGGNKSSVRDRFVHCKIDKLAAGETNVAGAGWVCRHLPSLDHVHRGSWAAWQIAAMGLPVLEKC